MIKSHYLIFTGVVVGLLASLSYTWMRYGPSQGRSYEFEPIAVSTPEILQKDAGGCDLSVLNYKQIGRDMQFLLYASTAGLAPYSVEIMQNGRSVKFDRVPHRNNYWFELKDLNLSDGKVVMRLKSLRKDCSVTASFIYDGSRKNEILPVSDWIREGSKDNMLDVRPVRQGEKLLLKDFANYTDGRTRVYLLDGIVVDDLEKGIEIQPGYLYSVTARWIDAPYNDWWNHLKNRTIRQQNLWIKGTGTPPQDPGSPLQAIPMPAWFTPSRDKRVQFDSKFPEFDPVKGKLVLQYRMNEDIAPSAYFKRGVTHLPHWEENVPFEKKHWTESPGFFGNKDQDWFGRLSKNEVEAYADRAAPDNVYAFDFEFWSMDYSPQVRQRLTWFAHRIRQRNPEGYLFDFWGGPAYRNNVFKWMGRIDPGHFLSDYSKPVSNHSNFEKNADGDGLGNYFNVTSVVIYPQPIDGADASGNTPNNYLVLSALHNSRINRLFPSQKNNKTIWYTWNRLMPLSKDPAVPMHVATANPQGDLFVNQLEMMPASQALGISLFSMVTDDGYYLWHDSKPATRTNDSFKLGPNDPQWGWEWYPADGVTEPTAFNKHYIGRDSPTYWDYPTDYMALGNWMSKQVEGIISGGKISDLAFRMTSEWIQPKPEQAVIAATEKLPFVTSVQKGNKLVVLAIDSFQPPNKIRHLTVRLPDGREARIQLYGNWPALYQGEIK